MWMRNICPRGGMRRIRPSLGKFLHAFFRWFGLLACGFAMFGGRGVGEVCVDNADDMVGWICMSWTGVTLLFKVSVDVGCGGQGMYNKMMQKWVAKVLKITYQRDLCRCNCRSTRTKHRQIKRTSPSWAGGLWLPQSCLWLSQTP